MSGWYFGVVSLSPPSTETVTVEYASVDGKAVAGADYAATSGSLSFPPQTATATIRVPVHADAEPEPPETSVNYTAGLTRANNMIVGLGPNGEVTVRCQQASGSAHFVLDVNGYFQ